MNEQLSGIIVYQDICAEIEMLKLRAEDQEKSLQYARRKMHNNGLPYVDGKPIVVSLDRALREYDDALVNLQATLEHLKHKEQIRQRIEQEIKQLQTLDKQVVYYRDALKLPLKVIAEKVGYSLDHVKRISSRYPKKIKRY